MELSHSLAYQQYSRIPDHVHVIDSQCKGASSHHHHQTNIPINIIKPAPKYLSDFSFKYCSINGLSSFGVHDNPRRRTAFKQGPAPWRGSNDYKINYKAFGILARSWLIENPNLLNWSLLLNAFIGLFALFCLNVYYVGINQIYDVDIDKVNKPELPLAAGDLSVESAWLLVIAFAVNGLLIVGLKGGPFLTCLYSLGLFVATAYSAPPFRLKRFAFGPMFTIVMMRGILLNIGLHYAARAAIRLTFEWTAPAVFITTFGTLFGVAISILKDLPDIEGDPTLATKLGVRNVAFLGTGLMLLNYGVGAFRRNVMILAHIFLAAYLIFQEAATKFYLFVWRLFFVEYVIYPFI
ncbi:hypothetical protein ACOSQ3_009136 [Xanthoceras sorbifolium]